MTVRRYVAIAFGIVALLCLTLFLTVWFIPDTDLQALAARALQQQGYSLRLEGFRKSLPLGVKAATLEISDYHGVLLDAREASLHLDLLPLLAGRVTFSAHAAIGPGRLQGKYSPRDGSASIEVKQIRLEDLPLIQAVTGAHATGVADVTARLKGKGRDLAGELQLQVADASIGGVKIGGMPLPDAQYRRIQGAARVAGGVISLGSFTLEGDGLYVRLKGDMPVTAPLAAAPLNLTLELMPKPEFLERQKFVFLLLAKYLTNPGHYQIPVKGTLGRPAVQ